ncbi:subunit sigma1 of clathrin adaptor complex [Chloropicon primus]|uniref:AP complex subunit sigma n=1 Tax=Chloropicon primus TaxID=1764295 RepID=A0A5B8MPN1_9CHLO|nr:subunit sigma1 of clathrin adaptor complex [Chloropicon primus]UPR01654.1 subunit sigma1 of clathrin adaptor complex [Chloropicon primus]|eukprot:QDZ22436.1 subunit sigma1 of clathrin adaptor complex [Chloropicon primus]
MIEFILLVNRQGKVRLTRWYTTTSQKERAKITRQIVSQITHRGSKLCNVLEWQDKKIIYRKYASLYFIAGVSGYENELSILEALHHFVESLDKYFGNVCELDLIYNFHKAYFVLDEVFLGGVLLETSANVMEKKLEAQERMMEAAKAGLIDS